MTCLPTLFDAEVFKVRFGHCGSIVGPEQQRIDDREPDARTVDANEPFERHVFRDPHQHEGLVFSNPGRPDGKVMMSSFEYTRALKKSAIAEHLLPEISILKIVYCPPRVQEL